MPPAPQIQGDIEFGVADLVALCWRRRLMFFVTTTLAVAVAVAYALTAEPAYEAETVLMPARSEQAAGADQMAGGFGAIAALGGVDLGGNASRTDKAIQILQSVRFLQAFIERRSLIAEVLDVETAPAVPQDGGQSRQLLDAAKVLQRQIVVSRDRSSSVVRVRLERPDANQAAVWLNDMIAAVDDELRAETVEEAEAAITFLRQLASENAPVEMREVTYRLIERETKSVMLANVHRNFVLEVIDPAVPPKYPSWPKLPIIVLAALVLGMVLGFVTVVVAELLSHRRASTA